ncbi:MAG: SDR family oxidoreductase [Actinomycetota bacterium]
MANPARPVPGHNLLADQSVVVTAAAGTGIGQSTARRALEEGAVVTISDWHVARLAETEQKLSADFPGRVTSAVCDVTREEDVTALYRHAAEAWGRIDVAVNNAGLGGEVSLLEMTDEQWFRVLDVTLNGTFRCTRAALRYFSEAGRAGVIVNNASVLGWRAQRGQAHYAAAKAGVMALTRCAAADAADLGVRVNAVAPSIALHPFLAKGSSPELIEQLGRQEMFGRGAEPWEIANVIIMLASGYTGYMTGEVVSVSSQHA